MSKGYEERYMMTLLSAVMNQKSAPEPLKRLNWDKMYRLADYHHIAHMIYYGIMGLKEELPQQTRQQFFEKYLEAVFRAERLQGAEKEIRTLLEREKLDCFIVDYTEAVKSYPIEEMCCCGTIEIGVERKKEGELRKILEEADFEKKKNVEERGYIYYRVPGIRVLSYDYRLFFSRRMRRYFKGLLVNLPFRKGYHYVRKFTADDKYLFYMCKLTDSYARGEISLNQIIDFWVFYKKNGEVLSWPYIYERLKALKISEFSERLEYLVLRWFGTGAGIENIEIYDAMESYILTKGAEGREISSQLLPLIKTVADCYARDRRAEKFKKFLEWTFPDRRYMETIYPFLERAGMLLPLFWFMRLGRYAVRFVWHKIEEKTIGKIKTMPFYQRIQEKFKRKSPDPEPEGEETELYDSEETLSDQATEEDKQKTLETETTAKIPK